MSIVDYLNNLAQEASENKSLNNPDINNFKTAKVYKPHQTQYYKALKLPDKPANGNYFTLGLPKHTPDYLLEANIDPNNRRNDTIKGAITGLTPPINYYYGNEGSYYHIPDGAKNESRHDELLQEAHNTFASYKNRFSFPEPRVVVEKEHMSSERAKTRLFKPSFNYIY